MGNKRRYQDSDASYRARRPPRAMLTTFLSQATFTVGVVVGGGQDFL